MHQSRMLRTLIGFLEKILFLLLVTMVTIVFANVIGRFFFHSALTWADEVVRFLFVWSTFIGATVGVAYGSHIGMDLLLQMVNLTTRRIMGVLSHLIVIVFLVVWAYYGWELVEENLYYLAPATGIPMGYIFIIGPVAAIAMALLLLIQLPEVLRNGPPLPVTEAPQEQQS